MTDRDRELSDDALIAFLRARSGERESGRADDRSGRDADAALAPAQSLWDALDTVRDDPRIREMRAAARARLAANDEGAADGADASGGENVNAGIGDGGTIGRSRAPGALKWAAIAACLALVSFLGLQPRLNRAPALAEQTARVLTNGQNAPRLFRLADGSQVTLDAGSRVDVAAWDGERRLTLRKGRAFFDVAHDPAHPFVVSAGGHRVTALGTRFVVSDRAGDPLALLERGRIRVADDDGRQSAELVPGQQVAIGSQGRYAISRTDAARASQWSTGEVTFDSVRIADVLARLNPYLEQPLELARHGDATAEISGTFQLGDAESLSAALQSMGMDVRPSPRGASAGSPSPPAAPSPRRVPPSATGP